MTQRTANDKPQRWILTSARVRDGLVRILQAIKPDPKKPLEVVVKRYRKSLSDEQRAYYRGVVLATISEATGYTGDELHELFKAKFGEASVIELAGETHEVHLFSTARGQSTTAEMAHYIDAIILWAATVLGIAISPPSHDLAERQARAVQRASELAERSAA